MTVGALLATALYLGAAEHRLTPIANSRFSRGVAAKSDHGDVSIALREMHVDISYSDGKARKGALMVLFDPSSGRYLWEFGQVPMNQQRTTISSGYGSVGIAYLASDRIVNFGFRPPFLVAHESYGRASGIDDAETKALAEATGLLPAKLGEERMIGLWSG